MNIVQFKGYNMLVETDSVKKVGSLVTLSVAVLAAKHFWQRWRLNKKLEWKRESCRKTLKEIQRQLQQVHYVLSALI